MGNICLTNVNDIQCPSIHGTIGYGNVINISDQLKSIMNRFKDSNVFFEENEHIFREHFSVKVEAEVNNKIITKLNEAIQLIEQKNTFTMQYL
jgi:hypothetical protein